jgi:type IV pilus assembly protein PilE
MINDKKGFTLIELMVVVAIIGIISAIAYPSYNSYIKTTRRSDAKVALTKIVDLEERFYLQYNTYTTDLTSAPSSGGLGMTSTTSGKGYYGLAVTSSNLLTGYTATADATTVSGSPQANDTGCTVMTLDSTGVKTPATCW